MQFDFYYPSSNKPISIHASKWIPVDEIKGIVQIVHGMTEHIHCYDDFAEFMCSKGYMVVGGDILGHGRSVTKIDPQMGYFADEDGNGHILRDLLSLHNIISREHPGVPYFMFGFSMGSYLVRQFIQDHGDLLRGAILMGTGFQPVKPLKHLMTFCKLKARFKSWYSCSRFIDNLSEINYNKRFPASAYKNAWLTSMESSLEQFQNDPLRNFRFTINAYYNMFFSILQSCDEACVSRVPRDLPIFMISGREDPMSEEGKAIETCMEQFKAAGLGDVSMKLYENSRHDIFHDNGRDEAFSDILSWISSRC